jgi:hypothetical protein
LAAVLTNLELPSTIRTFWLILPFYFFITSGLLHIWRQLSAVHSQNWHKWVWIGVALAVILGYTWSGLYFWHQATIFQPHYRPWHRNKADEVMATKMKELEPEFSEIIVSRFSGQPYIYLVLSGLISIEELQNSNLVRFEPSFTLSKYRFVPSPCPVEERSGVLYVINEKCPLTSAYAVQAKAPFRDGNDGYVFVKYEPRPIQKGNSLN